MKLYIAMGTYEFLKKMQDAHQEQTFLLLENENTCLLLHETEGDTLFKNPLKYVAIDRTGILNRKQGFAVLHYIPVSDEGRPIFEYRFHGFSQEMEKVPGLLAARVLQPQGQDTYVILTIWRHKADFQKWQATDVFHDAFSFTQTKTKKKKKLPQLFPRPAYMTKYSIAKES